MNGTGSTRILPAVLACVICASTLVSCATSQKGKPPATPEPFDAGDAEPAVARLVKLYEEGSSERVRSLGDSLLAASSPQEDRILYVLVQSELYEGRAEDALVYADRLVDLKPRSPYQASGFFLKGEAHRILGQWYPAAAAYLRAADTTDDPEVRENATSQAFDLVHTELTAEELQRLAREFSGTGVSSTIEFRIARRLFAEERYPEATVRLVDFLSLYPSSPFAPEARKLLQTARERSGSSPQAVPNVDPFSIGVLAPLSGRFSAYGDAFLKGTRLALDEFNQGRSIPVRMKLGDSGGDPLRVLRAVERLILEEGVIGISGPVLSVPTISAATRAQCFGVPLVSSTATQEGIADIGDYVFQNLVPLEAEITSVLTVAVRDLLLLRVALLVPAYGDGQMLASFARDEVERLGGEVLTIEYFDEGATDFTESLERIRDLSPDALFLIASVDELLLMLPQVRFHDIQGQLLGTSSVNTDKLLRLTSSELEGCIFPSDIYSGRTREENERFEELYRNLYHEEPSPVAVKAYFGSRILLEGLGMGASTREDLRSQLESLTRERNHPLSRVRQAEALSLLTIRNGKVVAFVPPTVAPGEKMESVDGP